MVQVAFFQQLIERRHPAYARAGGPSGHVNQSVAADRGRDHLVGQPANAPTFDALLQAVGDQPQCSGHNDLLWLLHWPGQRRREAAVKGRTLSFPYRPAVVFVHGQQIRAHILVAIGDYAISGQHGRGPSAMLSDWHREGFAPQFPALQVVSEQAERPEINHQARAVRGGRGGGRIAQLRAALDFAWLHPPAPEQAAVALAQTEGLKLSVREPSQKDFSVPKARRRVPGWDGASPQHVRVGSEVRRKIRRPDARAAWAPELGPPPVGPLPLRQPQSHRPDTQHPSPMSMKAHEPLT